MPHKNRAERNAWRRKTNTVAVRRYRARRRAREQQQQQVNALSVQTISETATAVMTGRSEK